MIESNVPEEHREPRDQRSIRVDDLVLDHLQRRLCGEPVSDAMLIASHPELMPELAEWLQAISQFAPDSVPSVGRAAQSELTVEPRRLRIRCPHCRQAVVVWADSDFSDILCSACGSQFNLTADSLDSRGATYSKTIAHFELIEWIGLGTFGTVWKARDSELDRIVAIKIPRRGQLDSERIQTCLREARAAAQLNRLGRLRSNPAVLGSADGRVFLSA